MKKVFRLFTFILLFTLVLLQTSSVHAETIAGRSWDGRIIFGSDFTLESGDTLEGDLVVFGGNVTIETTATVQGDLIVIGGNISMNGNVEGSAVMIGGSTTLGETSLVEGDLVTIGGSLHRDPDSKVKGEVVTNIPAPNIQIPSIPVPDVPVQPTPPSPPSGFNFDFNPFGRLLRMLATTIAVALLAMLASLFLQTQIERVSQAIIMQPVISGSVGLLVLVVAPAVLVILAVTIILIPVVVLAVAALTLAWLFGLVAMGTEVGERFTRAVNLSWAPPLTAGFGTFLMMLVVGTIGLVPCLGWFAPFLLALLGLGGVTLTVFGSQPYPRVALPAVLPEEVSEG